MWMQHHRSWLFWVYLALVVSIPLIAAQQQISQLSRIDDRGVLRVATRNIPTAYYEDAQGPAGFEYDLLSAFAKERNLKLELTIVRNRSDLFDLLKQRNVDMAAASLFQSNAREANFPTSDPYAFAVSQVVYLGDKIEGNAAQSMADLIGKRVLVQAGSAHAERLQELKQDLPGLEWEETEDMDLPDMLELLKNGDADYLISDNMSLSLYQPMYTSMRKAFTLDAPQPLVWYLAPTADKSLRAAINTFLASRSTQELISQLYDKYFEHTQRYDFIGIRAFRQHIKTRLGEYQPWFEEGADKYEWEWELLAALGYQESKWDNTAVSHTGVRGIMMLTLNTARSLGVDDRNNPEQSILGGARYLRRMYNLLPDRIPDPDRTWLALAAYNVGMGHLEDARILTQNAGLDPDRWSDVRQYLPKLALKRWYTQTNHGYARGWEPVIYVRNIRLYREILRLENLPYKAELSDLPETPRFKVFDRIPPTL
ncbi:membrane-bound lytic murein transglycosylase MltF [Pokkaliibacter sp. CJK22405]|uniref:membrane-bound lytic murein transglycosylase MltF n=1 Tax=Pokkaliibacter sp. CJK22405 TaxID=3384615 RepID=UPI0039855E5E